MIKCVLHVKKENKSSILFKEKCFINSKPIELIHTDLLGPSTTRSIGGTFPAWASLSVIGFSDSDFGAVKLIGKSQVALAIY